MPVINNKKYGDLKIFTKFAFGIYYAIAFSAQAAFYIHIILTFITT